MVDQHPDFPRSAQGEKLTRVMCLQGALVQWLDGGCRQEGTRGSGERTSQLSSPWSVMPTELRAKLVQRSFCSIPIYCQGRTAPWAVNELEPKHWPQLFHMSRRSQCRLLTQASSPLCPKGPFSLFRLLSSFTVFTPSVCLSFLQYKSY